MSIRIMGSEPIENGSIPFGKGTLEIRKITSVTGDDADENGDRSLVYDENGLSNNYVLCWHYEDLLYFLGAKKTFTGVFGMLDSRAEAISGYLLNQLSHEIPMVPVAKPDDVEDHNTIIFSDLLSVTKEVYGADSPKYKEMATDEVLLLVSQDVYARNVLAKLAGMIEKGYNEAHYEAAADEIAYIIQTARYITSSGEISGLNMTAVDNLWNLVQQKLRLATKDADSSCVVDTLS